MMSLNGFICVVLFLRIINLNLCSLVNRSGSRKYARFMRSGRANVVNGIFIFLYFLFVLNVILKLICLCKYLLFFRMKRNFFVASEGDFASTYTSSKSFAFFFIIVCMFVNLLLCLRLMFFMKFVFLLFCFVMKLLFILFMTSSFSDRYRVKFFEFSTNVICVFVILYVLFLFLFVYIVFVSVKLIVFLFFINCCSVML